MSATVKALLIVGDYLRDTAGGRVGPTFFSIKLSTGLTSYPQGVGADQSDRKRLPPVVEYY